MSHDPNLDSLKKRIQKAEKALRSPPAKKEGCTQFFHIGIELVSGVLVGVGLGILGDKIFETSPWGLIIFFLLGSVAGMINVYRVLTGRRSHSKDP